MMDSFTVNYFQAGRQTLAADVAGGLVLTDAEGVVHHGVIPVRAFPIDAAGEGLSLMGSDGHELVWIERLSDLDPSSRQVISEELAKREFMPVIQRIEAVSSFSTPSTWSVMTNRGRTEFILKGEEDIRRLRSRALLITDSYGVTYHVIDQLALDRISRRLLDRFL